MSFGQDGNEGHDGENPEFHFYYNREERLARAPKIVQDHYNGTGLKIHKNLFAWLVATPFSKMILIVLIAFMALALILFRNVPESWQKKIGEITVSLTSFSYIDKVYASVSFEPPEDKKNGNKSNAEGESSAAGAPISLPVSVTFFALSDGDSIVFETKIDELYEGKELFVRTEFSDFDIIKVRAEIEMQDTALSIVRKVEKNK